MNTVTDHRPKMKDGTMPSNTEPTQPLTDADERVLNRDLLWAPGTDAITESQMSAIRTRHSSAAQPIPSKTALGYDHIMAHADRAALLAEVDRLRAENAAQAAKLEAVRKIQQQRRNSAMVTSEQLAAMRGWNDAVDAIREALNPCTCSLTDPSTWTTYGGLTEPGSTYQWEPDCPTHGDAPALDQSEEGQANG
jgi:hypothetical protein